MQDRQKEMILVTGATGFVGRHVVSELLTEGFRVSVLVRNAGGRELPFGEEVTIVDGDILNPLDLEVAMNGVHAVVHAAAVVSFWKKDAEKLMRVNAEGTANVVNACLDTGARMIHVSSIAALGIAQEGELVSTETTWKPGEKRSAYSKSKWRAEREVFRGISEGITAHIVNPSIILGPTHNWEEGTGKLFRIVDRGLRFYNPGASGFVGVDDVSRAIVEILKRKDLDNGEQFLLNAENLPFRELFTMIAQALGKKPPSSRLPKLPTMLVATLSEWMSLLRKQPPVITRESMQSGFLSRRFDGSDFGRLGLKYRSIQEVISEAAGAYRQSQ